jgi:hypothetical protein
VTLQVSGGVGGVAACLAELDDLATGLADAAADCADLVGGAVGAAAGPAALGVVLHVDPVGAVRLLDASVDAVGSLCRAAAGLGALAAALASAVTAYRACEGTVEAVVEAVPLVVATHLRTGGVVLAGGAAVAATVAVAPAAAALVVAGGAAAVVLVPGASDAIGERLGQAVDGAVDRAVGTVVDGIVARPWLVDAAVRTAPGLLGVPDVRTAAALVSRAGQASGLLEETPVVVRTAPSTGCGPPGGPSRPAGGVADLLRRGQSVASWREPGPGGHDSLPPGAPRPAKGQVRVDEVRGPDGQVAWVVHVPGTQEWDGDGRGSPMDMTANVALVAGADTAVAAGVVQAMTRAGVRPGEPVALVGHSQGGMTAMHVAADPRVRQVATVTHVVTAGSPVAGDTPPPGVQVLALEHPEDLVPRLDGRDHPDHPDVVTVPAPAPDGPWRTDAVPAHSSSAYVATAEQVDTSPHPSLVAYRDGLAPFLDRQGATCRTHQVVLRREPGG